MRDSTFLAHLRANFWLYALSTVMILAGIGAGIIGTAIDFDVWTSTATTPLAKMNYGGGSIIFGICTLTFAACASRLWRDHRVIFGGAAFLVLVGFSLVSMVGIVGSGTKERLVPYAEGQAELLAKQEAVRQTNALQKSYVDKQLAYLQERGRQAKGPQSKQAAYTSASETFGSLEVKPEPVLATRKDPIAEAINSLRPDWHIETIILVTSVAWGIALKLAEMLLIGFGVAMWPKAPARAESAPAAKETAPEVVRIETPPEAAPVASNIIHPPQFAGKAPVAEIAPEPEDVSPELQLEVREHLTEVEQVNEFWATQTRPAPAASIGVTAMYKHYCGWAAENDLRPVSQKKFGTIASNNGIVRDKRDTSCWKYVGHAIVSDGQEAGLLMVA